MTRWLRSTLQLATLALAAVSIAALLPFLGQPAPALAQLGIGGSTCNFGGSFGGGFNGSFGGCTFGTGFSGTFSGGSFNGGSLGSFSGSSGGSFNGSLGFGGFALATDQASVRPGEDLPLALAWIVPPPATWRDLTVLEVRLRRGAQVALWLRWDESTNMFFRIDPATGQTVGRGRRPGTPGQIGTNLAVLRLAGTVKQDSGAGGDSVAVLLPVRFTAAAAGRSYLVEVGARHDDGEVFLGTVGKVTVEAP